MLGILRNQVFIDVNDPDRTSDKTFGQTPKWINLGKSRFTLNPAYPLSRSEGLILVADLLQAKIRTQDLKPSAQSVQPVQTQVLKLQPFNILSRREFVDSFAETVYELYGAPNSKTASRKVSGQITVPLETKDCDDFSAPPETDWNKLLKIFAYPWREAYEKEANAAKYMSTEDFKRVAIPLVGLTDDSSYIGEGYELNGFATQMQADGVIVHVRPSGYKSSKLPHSDLALGFEREFPDFPNVEFGVARAPILRKLLSYVCGEGTSVIQPQRFLLHNYLTSTCSEEGKRLINNLFRRPFSHASVQHPYDTLTFEREKLEHTVLVKNAQAGLLWLLTTLLQADNNRLDRWKDVFQEMQVKGLFGHLDVDAKSQFEVLLTKFAGSVRDLTTVVNDSARLLHGELSENTAREVYQLYDRFKSDRKNNFAALSLYSEKLKVEVQNKIAAQNAKIDDQELEILRLEEEEESRRQRIEEAARSKLAEEIKSQEQKIEAEAEAEAKKRAEDNSKQNFLQRGLNYVTNVVYSAGESTLAAARKRLDILKQEAVEFKARLVEYWETKPVVEKPFAEVRPAPVVLSIPLPEDDNIISNIDIQLSNLEHLTRQTLQLKEIEAAFSTSNVYVETEVDLLYLDLVLETGLVFAMHAKQVPAWLMLEIVRTVGAETEEQLIFHLKQVTCDPRFWKTWLLDHKRAGAEKPPLFQEFKAQILQKYQKDN